MSTHSQSQLLRELIGVIESVRHYNPEDGWTVARVRVSEGSGANELASVVGNLAEAREGMEVVERQRLWDKRGSGVSYTSGVPVPVSLHPPLSLR